MTSTTIYMFVSDSWEMERTAAVAAMTAHSWMDRDNENKRHVDISVNDSFVNVKTFIFFPTKSLCLTSVLSSSFTLNQ